MKNQNQINLQFKFELFNSLVPRLGRLNLISLGFKLIEITNKTCMFTSIRMLTQR